MTTSSRQSLIESAHPAVEIDLEDLSRQSSHYAEDRGRPWQQPSHLILPVAMWIAENLRTDSWRGTNSDKIFENLSRSDHESLKKNYYKIARRPNLHTVERVFMYGATNKDELNFTKHDTWAACFDRVLSTGEMNDAAVFEVCVVSTDTTNLGRAFSFIDKTFLISYDRRQQAYSSLSEMVVRVFQSKWRLSDETMAKSMESLYTKEPSLTSWRPRLPSYQAHPSIDIGPCGPLRFEFKWIHAPHYATDLSVYVFRPYGKHPKTETLDVILPSSQFEQLRRAMVIVNSHSTLTKLRNGRFRVSMHALEHNILTISYALHFFQAVCSEVTTELVTFTTRACEEINYMVYEGRLRPSGSKLQYLRHLQDCQIIAKDSCMGNRNNLQLFLDKINSIQGPRTNEEAKNITNLELMVKDLEYLHDEIESSLLRVWDLRRDLREHLDLLQIRRTSILGMLAALYLPLSFVTSFFGMNLNQYTNPQPFWHNVTVVNDGTNSNELIVDSGNNQTWSLQNFFEIAMPLMVGTIFVPLVIGSIIRVILQGLARGRIWWRLVFATIVIGYSVILPFFGPTVISLIPYLGFIALQLFTIFKSERRSWLRVVFWLLSTVILIVILVSSGSLISQAVVNGIYGISLFIFWWWKPNFYYRWDQGGRSKSKED